MASIYTPVNIYNYCRPSDDELLCCVSICTELYPSLNLFNKCLEQCIKEAGEIPYEWYKAWTSALKKGEVIDLW